MLLDMLYFSPPLSESTITTLKTQRAVLKRSRGSLFSVSTSCSLSVSWTNTSLPSRCPLLPPASNRLPLAMTYKIKVKPKMPLIQSQLENCQDKTLLGLKTLSRYQVIQVLFRKFLKPASTAVTLRSQYYAHC